MTKRSKNKISRRKRPACGLCGRKTNLTQTDCCGQWICDDADQYVAFSYARNSCYRNHDRFTLCGYHHNEEHPGDWKECPECKADFSHELEMYVHYGTNEYNFEKLADPPTFEPTYCSQCGEQIHLGLDGYSVHMDAYTCDACSDPLPGLNFDDILSLDDEDDFPDINNRPQRLGPDDIDQIPAETMPRFQAIARPIKAFSAKFDVVEFGFLCLDMLISLCVQFPEKVRRGKPDSWACGIVHAAGMINFLSDPETEPHVEPFDIYTFFDVSQSTMQSKSLMIRELLGTFQMDPLWCLPELLLEIPMMWVVPMDGKMIDLRDAPKTVQQRAVDEGLLPITPDGLKQQIEDNRNMFQELKNDVLNPVAPPNNGETPNIKFNDHRPETDNEEEHLLFQEIQKELDSE